MFGYPPPDRLDRARITKSSKPAPLRWTLVDAGLGELDDVDWSPPRPVGLSPRPRAFAAGSARAGAWSQRTSGPWPPRAAQWQVDVLAGPLGREPVVVAVVVGERRRLPVSMACLVRPDASVRGSLGRVAGVGGERGPALGGPPRRRCVRSRALSVLEAGRALAWPLALELVAARMDSSRVAISDLVLDPKEPGPEDLRDAAANHGSAFQEPLSVLLARGDRRQWIQAELLATVRATIREGLRERLEVAAQRGQVVDAEGLSVGRVTVRAGANRDQDGGRICRSVRGTSADDRSLAAPPLHAQRGRNGLIRAHRRLRQLHLDNALAGRRRRIDHVVGDPDAVTHRLGSPSQTAARSMCPAQVPAWLGEPGTEKTRTRSIPAAASSWFISSALASASSIVSVTPFDPFSMASARSGPGASPSPPPTKTIVNPTAASP